MHRYERFRLFIREYVELLYLGSIIRLRVEVILRSGSIKLLTFRSPYVSYLLGRFILLRFLLWVVA